MILGYLMLIILAVLLCEWRLNDKLRVNWIFWTNLWFSGGWLEEKWRAKVCTLVHGSSCVYWGVCSCSWCICAHGSCHGGDQKVLVPCKYSEICSRFKKDSPEIMFIAVKCGYCVFLSKLSLFIVLWFMNSKWAIVCPNHLRCWIVTPLALPVAAD